VRGTLLRSIGSLCALMLVLGGSVASAQEATWQIEGSPNAHATQHNFLNDIACVGDSHCWAVGYYRAANAYQAIIQQWDGSSWTLAPVPDSSATRDDFVQGVGCASTSRCFAVGYSWSRPDNAYRSLVLEWDGTSWSNATPSDTSLAGNSFLIDVTCSASDDCWAVGSRQVGLLGGGFGPRQTLIMHWDGTSWETVASPITLPFQGNALASVTCVMPSDCWAVGYYGASGADQTLALHWDGSEWDIVTSPNKSATQQNLLNGVSCIAADDCWAVGIVTPGVNQTLIQHWDGEAWSIVESPNSGPNNANVLFNVSCLSADECWAAGYHKPHPWLENLMLVWDGSAWSIAPSPNSAPGQTNTLRAISCTPGYGCWAAGNYYGTGSISRTLILRYQQTQAELTATEIDLRLEHVRGDIVATALLHTIHGDVGAGEGIVFSLNGQEWDRVITAPDGNATASFHRSEIKKDDVVEARFLGNEALAPSHASTQMSN